MEVAGFRFSGGRRRYRAGGWLNTVCTERRSFDGVSGGSYLLALVIIVSYSRQLVCSTRFVHAILFEGLRSLGGVAPCCK